MKRIGIITYHRATNYGAVLQAYSLVNRIKKDIANDVEVEIIDYATRAASNDHVRTVLSTFVHDGIMPGITEYRKNRVFDRFSWNLPISQKRFVSDEINRAIDFMNQEYDVVISGSDAVFSWNGKRFPSIYLLGENASFKKMSYAASAHRLAYKDEPKERIDYCQKAFGSFDYLGIRDAETERFVKYCLPNADIHHNCDPSFLIDLEEIKQQVDFSKFSFSNKPLILVMSPNERIGQEIVRTFGEKYEIASLFIKNRAIPKHFGNLTPFEWATLFEKAALTITDYFHATIFSMLNGTPVVSVDSSSLSKGYEGKIHDLMCGRLQLYEMYLNVDDIAHYGEKIVSQRAKEVIDSELTSKIAKAMNSESMHYSSFKEALYNLLNS